MTAARRMWLLASPAYPADRAAIDRPGLLSRLIRALARLVIGDDDSDQPPDEATTDAEGGST